MSTQRPNVLWIFSDQHRASAIGCYGDPNIETPHLDRLAREGIRFTNAYSSTPICSPFRACLYTGQHITTHGVTSLFRPLLPAQQPELPEVLREAGYHTSHMGKWHLGGGDCPTHYVTPYFRPGWDEWLGWENSNVPMATTYSVGDHPHPVRTLPGYQTDALTDLTLEWLRAQPPDRPWFHVVSVEPPHSPNIAPEPYMAMFADRPLEFRPNYALDHPQRERNDRLLRGYYAQIKDLDDNVGRILAALEQTGQLDNTIVCYLSDHGDMMGSHGRQQKSRPEEESANIPLIVRYPRRIPAGVVSDAFIGGVDLMPTLLGLLGIAIPQSVEGEDLSGVLTGERQEGADAVLLQYETAFFPFTPHTVFRALRTGRWLYSHFLTQGPAQLFDLEADPCELHNLIDAPDHEATRQRLHAMLADRLERLNDDYLARAAAHAAASS